MKSIFYLETLLVKLLEAKQPFTLPTVGLLVPDEGKLAGWEIYREKEGVSFIALGATLGLIEPEMEATAKKDLEEILNNIEPGESFAFGEAFMLQKTGNEWGIVPLDGGPVKDAEEEDKEIQGAGFLGKIRSEWVIVTWLVVGFGTVLAALYRESRLAYTDLKMAIPVESTPAILPDNTDYLNTSMVDSAWKMDDTLQAVGDLETLNVPGKIPPKPQIVSQKYYEVVVGSYQTATQANSGMKLWADQGFEAHILFPEGAKETTFRVSVFTSPTLEQADSIKNVLRPKVDAWVLLRR